MSVWAWASSWLKKLIVLIGILCFIGSGLIINVLQFALLPLYILRRQLFRHINVKLVYLNWAIIPFAIQTWAQYDIRIFVKSGESDVMKHADTEHALCILNHRGDMDWAVGWCINDRIGMLTTAKAIMKDVAKWLPGIGWMFIFMEFPFLKRSWKDDEVRLAASCRNLADYPKNMLLVLFAEGTRFTEEKHRISVEFAKQRGLPELKHHLLPRTKGFSFLVKHMKDVVPAVYDVTLSCREGTPTLKRMIDREHCAYDVLIRRIPMSEVPSETEQASADWLMKLYQEKDEYVDYHIKHKTFPQDCEQVHLPKTLWPDIVMGFWILVLGLPILLIALYLMWVGAWLPLITTGILILVVNQLFAMLIHQTEVKRGSAYGLQPASHKKTVEGSDLKMD